MFWLLIGYICVPNLSTAESASGPPPVDIGYPGTFCGIYTVNRNSGYQTYLETLFNWDIWAYCNYGSGVNVTITIDSWMSTPFPNGPYVEGAHRPVTWHCHCP